ncbi:MAG TPA: hypothetical protein VGN81_00980 [Pseudonocardiaceae bacterium]
MTDDRLTRYQSEPTDRIPTRRAPGGDRPAPIPVRRGQLKPVRQQFDPGDAHTEELPVMSDEEFEAIQEAATRRIREQPEPVATQEESVPGKPRRRTFLGGITGTLTAATVIIALVAVAAQVFSSALGKPGPGLLDVAGQAVLALLAVLAQRGVDRRRGARRGWFALLVLLFAGASFGVFWFAWLWLFWSV